jgi:hypothetical protein
MRTYRSACSSAGARRSAGTAADDERSQRIIRSLCAIRTDQRVSTTAVRSRAE